MAGGGFFFWQTYHQSSGNTTTSNSIPQKAEKTDEYSVSGLLSSKTREVNFSTFSLSFDIPGWLVTPKELGIINPYSSLGNALPAFYSPDTKGDKNQAFQESGLVTSFSPQSISGTPNMQDIDKILQNDLPGKTTSVDVSHFFSQDSLLSPANVRVYTSPAPQINGSQKGLSGYIYRGVILMHVAFPDSTQGTIGINFFCYDLDSAKAPSSRCREVLSTLLSTLRLKNAILLPVAPLYSEKDIFGTLPFLKRQIISDTSKLTQNSDGISKLREPFASTIQNTTLTALQDTDLSVMRCLPQSMYFTNDNTPYPVPKDSAPYSTPFTIIDPNLLKIISLTQESVGKDHHVDELLACQTDDNRYLVLYVVPPQSYTADESDTPSRNAVMFAQINADWTFTPIATALTAATSTKKTACTTPVLLTSTNTLYLECDLAFPAVPGNHVEMRSQLFAIDFANKKTTLVTTCDNTWESVVSCY